MSDIERELRSQLIDALNRIKHLESDLKDTIYLRDQMVRAIARLIGDINYLENVCERD